jgi:hypothetical protein
MARTIGPEARTDEVRELGDGLDVPQHRVLDALHVLLPGRVQLMVSAHEIGCADLVAILEELDVLRLWDLE